jgi:hypothetical protein
MALKVTVLLLIVGLLAPEAILAQESTVEQLQELQELRNEVERRRGDMRRELRLLQQVLGDDERSGQLNEYERSLQSMTSDELAAELRILREDLERLRQNMEQRNKVGEQPRFAVTGQIRNRLEWSDLDFTSGDGDVVELLRSRLRVTARPQEKTTIVFEVQDGRQWGEEANTLDGSAGQLDFHQAYLKLENMFGQPFSFTAGRQELVYGSERLIGAVGWSNTGRAFDALRLHFGEESHGELFVAKLDEKGIRGESTRDRNLWGIEGHFQRDRHAAQPYALFEHDKNTGTKRLRRATAGLRGAGKFVTATGHVLGYEVEAAGQAGDDGLDEVRAFMAGGRLSYEGPGWNRPYVTAGLDYLSGDGSLGDNQVKVFNTLFATNHTYYGMMDLFPQDITDAAADNAGKAGLSDIFLKGELSASESTRLVLHIHHFTLAKSAGAKNMGQEADVLLTHQLNSATSVQWGGLIFVPGDAMKAFKGGEDPAFKMYLQTIARF